MYSQTIDGDVKNWMSFFCQHTASKSPKINNKKQRRQNISHAANTHVTEKIEWGAKHVLALLYHKMAACYKWRVGNVLVWFVCFFITQLMIWMPHILIELYITIKELWLFCFPSPRSSPLLSSALPSSDPAGNPTWTAPVQLSFPSNSINSLSHFWLSGSPTVRLVSPLTV